VLIDFLEILPHKKVIRTSPNFPWPLRPAQIRVGRTRKNMMFLNSNLKTFIKRSLKCAFPLTLFKNHRIVPKYGIIQKFSLIFKQNKGIFL
jgi:hypothetical protein